MPRPKKQDRLTEPPRVSAGVKVGVAILVIAVIAVAGGLLRPYLFPSTSASSGHHTAFTPSAVPSISTKKGINEESLDPKKLSADAKPSADEIWGFETAYNIANPAARDNALAPYVTTQYLSANEDNEALPGQDLTIVIVTAKSSVHVVVDVTKYSCEVTTQSYIETIRDGKVVNSYKQSEMQSHHTIWVNTQSGWKVAEDLG
jgi:hypothetical protein